MKKILTIIALLLAAVLLIAGFAYILISRNIAERAAKIYNFPTDTMQLMPTAKLIERGKHLIAIKGCTDCHSNDLGGKVFLNDPKLGKINASNLTSGQGGLPANYSTNDWVMSLRHGVNKKHQALWIMPSQETNSLSKEDLRSIIAYCKQVPPVNRKLENNKIGPVLNIMAYLDKLPLFPVEKIDHAKSMIESTVSYDQQKTGKYLSVSCTGCHRENFKGGDSPIPGMPHIPDITANGSVGKWTEIEFMRTLRTGRTPAGHVMKNENMPWKMTARYTDQELQALYIFLKTQK